MLDEKDLQAIAQIMDEKISASEERMNNRMDKRISESEERMNNRMDRRISESEQHMSVLMESYFDPKFELLADSIKDIQEKLVPRCRVDDLEDEVKFLKVMYRQMVERVALLEKAN